MKKIVLLLTSLGLIGALATTSQAQEIQRHSESIATVEYKRSQIWYTETDVSVGANHATVLFDFCRNNRKLCLLAGIELIIIDDLPDPAGPIDPIFPVGPFPGPDPGPWVGFDLCQLVFGKSTIAMPILGVTTTLNDKLSLSLTMGVGIQSHEAKTTQIGDNNFTIPAMSYPVSRYMLGGSYALGNRFSVSIGGGVHTSYRGNLNVQAEDGSLAIFESNTTVSPTLTVGVGIKI